MFGERGLMIESARTGTVITTTPLHVAVLSRKDYKTILEDSQLGIPKILWRKNKKKNQNSEPICLKKFNL